jgi:hypothetical protein
MKVAIIIPTATKDIGGDLSELLTSLEASCEACEFDFNLSVTVVFNGSSVKSFHPPARLAVKNVTEDREGLVFARHRGVRENPDADYFVFLDDDVVLGLSYLEGLMEVVTESAPLATGALKPLWAAPPPEWILHRYNSGGPWPNLPFLSIMEPPKGTTAIDPMYAWGANFIISKSALLKAGGFHPDGFPKSKYILRGDGETHVAETLKIAGFQAKYSDFLAVGHRVPADRLNIEYLIRRMLMEGIGTSYRQIRQNADISLPEGLTGLGATDFETLVKLVKDSMASVDPEHVDKAESTARSLGYYWHQLACRDNPLIANWCRQAHYFI